jgi:DNA-nicking Smr family endonuclease
MIVKDFHGMTVEEARYELHLLLAKYYKDILDYGMSRNMYKLITGTGDIQDTFKNILYEQDISHVIHAENMGEIIIL